MGDKSTKQGQLPPIKVYVFGGGVTGMTAAHELILRGFDVYVYESERALGPQGMLEVPTLGGMARTQYAAVEAEKPSQGDQKDVDRARLYYRESSLPVLAERFLAKYSGERAVLIKGFAPLQTQRLVIKFMKRAFIEGLKASAAGNEALEVFFKALSKHLVEGGLVEAFLRGFTKELEQALGKLHLELGELPEDFRLEDLIRRQLIQDFKDEIGQILRALDQKKGGQAEGFDILHLVKPSLVALGKVPPGRPNRRMASRIIATAYVKALDKALRTLAEPPRDEKLRSRLLEFLKDLLAQPQPDAAALKAGAFVELIPWHVSEPLIEVLRRLLEGRTRDRWVEYEELEFINKNADLGPGRGLALGSGQGPESARYFPQFWLCFEEARDGGSPQLTPDSQRTLQEAVQSINKLFRDREFTTGQNTQAHIQILVQSFKEPKIVALDGAEPEGGQQGAMNQPPDLASLVKEMLAPNGVKLELRGLFAELDPVLQESVKIYDGVSGGLGAGVAQAGFAPLLRNWVRVVVYRPQLPGEHGYRFFPSYYRHVFDTMKRIPLHDMSEQPVGGTVLDNLVPLPQIGIFSTQSAPFLMSWNPLQLGDALSRTEYNLRNASNLHLQSQDLLQFSLRVLRYMTSCSQRRAEEMEELSWWDYLEGYDPRTQTRLYYQYSEPFKQLVQSSSRVLAALDGAAGDARTCGNTYVQLLTQALVPTPQHNCTLNGPTSEAWLLHWRAHLKRLGVKFCYGELQKLKLSGGGLEAEVYLPSKQQVVSLPETQKEPVYFVVATDLVSAATVTSSLRHGIPRALKDYVNRVPEQPGSSRSVRRNPEKKFSRQRWDRLQTISGIQYFFKRHVNLFDGYIYCVDAEWGLSAICSHQVWQDRPIASQSEYQSILSVDIGDWNTDSQRLKKKAWECTPEELAEEVLHQLRVSLSARGPAQSPASFVLPDPDWTHIDESLEYGKVGKKRARLRRNRTPYLVPIAGDWKHRPGPEPWDPTYQAPLTTPWTYDPNVWQAPHGGYPIHYDRLVFAGTYLRTFTRMTTMESANESARHAVNAILDHCVATVAPPQVWQGFWNSPAGGSLSNPYEKGIFPTTPFGDYCRIWNPERNELPDFELLQRQDEQAWRERRAHPWDSAGLEMVPSMLAQLYGSGALMDQLIKQVVSQNKSTPLAVQGLLAALRHLRQMLEVRPPDQRR